MKSPTITTDRLLLDALAETDAPALFQYRSAPEVCRFQSWEPESMDDALEFIKKQEGLDFGAPDTWFQLGVRLRDCGTLVGDIGLHFLPPKARQVEIGFTISPHHQRQGFAREATAALLQYLFETMDKHRVMASGDPRNAPSVVLLNKLGMRQEGHFIKSYWFKGQWADDMVFAILKEEWRA